MIGLIIDLMMIDLINNIMKKKKILFIYYVLKYCVYLLNKIDNINKKYKDTIDNINEQNNGYLKKNRRTK